MWGPFPIKLVRVSDYLKNTTNQALGMMATSGIPINKLIGLFTEVEGASAAFIDILKQTQKDIEKDQKLKEELRH